MKFLEPSQILFLRADNTYTEIMLDSGSKIIVSRTLKNFEESLEHDSTFFRCHKSYMVNLSYVEEYSRSDGGFLIMKDKSEIPVTQDKIHEFLERVKVVKRK
jgi:two-component system LytT family response regulator